MPKKLRSQTLINKKMTAHTLRHATGWAHMQAHKLWVCVKRIIFHERDNLEAQGSTVPSPWLIATMALCAIDCNMTEHGEVITEQ